jgi:hypothetical protein
MRGVTKRGAVLVALVAVAGLAAGGVIGFIWHAPGQASTWNESRGWGTFAVVSFGLAAALWQLGLQRRQLGLLQRDLSQREQILERQQANCIDLTWTGNVDNYYMGIVRNESDRPIWNVVCQIELAPGQGLQPATATGRFEPSPFPGQEGKHVFREDAKGSPVSLIRVDQAHGFVFSFDILDHRMARIPARFTDDAGLHWQIDHDLHLAKLEHRDW